MPTRTDTSADIILHREYDAPVSKVWEAWTDKSQADKWWGPRGFTNTTHSSDVRSGGFWKYTMHGPDGATWENFTTYTEVEKYKKLAYDHGGTETSKPLFKVNVTFAEVNGKTKMDMTMTLPSADAAVTTRGFIKKANGNTTWDRLAEFLEKQASGKDVFVINRTFDAPIDLMFEMWTDPAHIAKWTAPTGSVMKFFRSNIVEGGDAFYEMTNGNDLTMYARNQYKEIRTPDRLVYTQQFCDENENISRHPLAPTWPETFRTTVQFTAEGPDSTRISILWEPVGSCTQEEIDTFVNARGGMTQGWTGCFDQLEAYLEKQ